MRKPLIIALAVVALMVLVPAAVLGGFALADRGGDRAAVHYSGSPDGDLTPWLGVSIADLNAKLASRLDISWETGVVVLHVIADSPADDAGLQRGDVLVSVDGESVDSAKDVAQAVQDAAPGEVLALSVQRDGSTLNVDATIGEHPWKTQRVPLLWPRYLKALDGNVQRAEFTVEGAGGATVDLDFIAGAIDAVEDGSVTVTPADGADALSLTVGDRVHVSKGWKKVDLADLSSGDEVLVVLQDRALVALVARQEKTDGEVLRGRSGPHTFFLRSERSGDREAAEQAIQRLMQRMEDIQERSLRELHRDFERRLGQRLPNDVPDHPQLAIPWRGG